jgi:hypothetical protein
VIPSADPILAQLAEELRPFAQQLARRIVSDLVREEITGMLNGGAVAEETPRPTGFRRCGRCLKQLPEELFESHTQCNNCREKRRLAAAVRGSRARKRRTSASASRLHLTCARVLRRLTESSWSRCGQCQS